jgi:hypothetical protein
MIEILFENDRIPYSMFDVERSMLDVRVFKLKFNINPIVRLFTVQKNDFLCVPACPQEERRLKLRHTKVPNSACGPEIEDIPNSCS